MDRQARVQWIGWLGIFLISIASLASADLGEREVLVGGSARLIGLGSAAVAGPPEGTAIFWNPALLGTAEGTEFGFTDLPLQPRALEREGFLSVLVNGAAWGSRHNGGSLGLATWFDGWGKDPEKNRIIRTGIGVPLGLGLAVGANLVHERRNTNLGTDVGWGFDLGALWRGRPPAFGHELRLGIVAQRLAGRRSWINGWTVETPLRLRGGLGFLPDRDTWLTADLVYTRDLKRAPADRWRVHLGLERWFFNRVALRVGYTGIAHYDRFSEGEWSRGFSVRTRSGELSYAYVSGGSLKHGIHWLSATLRWEWPAQPTVPRLVSPTALDKPAPRVVSPRAVTLAAQPRVFSPNGDGRVDVVLFQVGGEDLPEWLLRIQDAGGDLVRELSPVRPHWNGLDAAGSLVSEGTYQVTLVDAQNPDQVLASTSVQVDTTPPSLTIATEPFVVMSGESQQRVVIEVPKIHVQVSDAHAIRGWALTIQDATGQSWDSSGEGPPPPVILWKEPPESFSSGTLSCALEVEDIAGNRASSTAEIHLIDLAALNSRREKRGFVMTLPGVAFDTNSAEIKPEFHEALQHAAELIRSYPGARVRVEGHTDNRGTESYNMQLSVARANAVMEYLITTFNLDPNRFQAVGYGETRPIADNETEEGRRQNRRVEIVLLLTDEGQPSVPETSAPPTSPEPTRPETSAKPQYTVSVGSFRDRKNAEELLKMVQALNLPHEIRLLKVPMGNITLYRVTIGAFTEAAPAEQLAKELEKEHGLLPVVMPYE